MSPRLQRVLALGLIAAGSGTVGYAATGLAGTDGRLQSAERAAKAVEVRLGADDPGKPCRDRDRDRDRILDSYRPPEL